MTNKLYFEALDRSLRDIMRFSDPKYANQPFGDWIILIGEGATDKSNEGEAMVDIPDEVLINVSNDPIKTIVESMYSNILKKINDFNYFQERAILAPILLNVDVVNQYYTTEYLNSIRMSGPPNHVLKLKVGALVILLKNIDKSLGLWNNTRLIISQLRKHVLEAKIISGSNVGQKIIIPRMNANTDRLAASANSIPDDGDNIISISTHVVEQCSFQSSSPSPHAYKCLQANMLDSMAHGRAHMQI
ncbi:uncharacterized protein [Elaeis guineensis]|uniref:uncharacterized protein n=1 Tax=Elaeis guineensis var. tenera TaxID=51953 RepID=UPI003C6D0618